MLLAAGIGGAVLLLQPRLGLLALVAAALVVPLEFGTGTEVSLNLATLLIPTLSGIWLLDAVRRRDLRLARSRTTAPLFLFLLAGLISLLIGNVLWDPAVPRSDSFILVQLAQWAIFAFSALVYWLAGNLLKEEAWLHRLLFSFLALAGGLAILFVLPVGAGLVSRVVTIVFIRAPFWLLLMALAGGQLLFNKQLSSNWRLFLLLVLAAVIFYSFDLQQEAASNWVGVVAVGGVLIWLRWPRLRWPIIAFVAAGFALGVLIPSVYQFAGGDAEWNLSGASRLGLIERVIQLTMRNPITGLGPAAYRPYGLMQPLVYGRTYWVEPRLNSHNNYVDLFSQTGLVGLGLFLWFMIELAVLGWRLHRRHKEGFVAGYVNAMLAAWVGIMAIMMLADWFLPFVYNIGFGGFQASVLVWLFLGGLMAIENLPVVAPDKNTVSA